MRTLMNDEIKRSTARRRRTLVLEVIQGKTMVAEASSAHDPPASQIERGVEDGRRGTQNPLRANPQDAREQYEKQLEDLQKAYGRSDARAACSKENAVAAGRGQEVIVAICQGLKQDSDRVSIGQLCRWFEVLRRTVY